MLCPYCGAEMSRGHLFGDRSALKWKPESSKMIDGAFMPADAFQVGNSPISGRPKALTHYCEACQKLVIDLHAQI